MKLAGAAPGVIVPILFTMASGRRRTDPRRRSGHPPAPRHRAAALTSATIHQPRQAQWIACLHGPGQQGLGQVLVT